eukprot:SAG11_NODE_99_length_16913_cov_41.552813_3_plen_90_part_00
MHVPVLSMVRLQVALVIGIQDYDRGNELQSPNRDAKELGDGLRRLPGVPADCVIEVTDSHARVTKSMILDAVKRVCLKVRQDYANTVIV